MADQTTWVPKQNKADYIVKVFCGLLFILVTELCLGVSMYRFMIKEYHRIEINYVLKSDFQQYFLSSAQSDAYRELLKSIFENFNGRSSTPSDTRVKRGIPSN